MATDEQFEEVQTLQRQLVELVRRTASGTVTKIDLIRAYRNATGVGLKDSKDYVESLQPSPLPPSELEQLKARVAALEAAGNRLGDAAVDGVLTSIEAVTELAEAKARIAELEDRLHRQYAILLEHKSRAEKAEAELDISREAHRMVQSALLSQAAETERAETRVVEFEARIQRQYAILLEHKSRAERAEAELKVARAALEPFADIASNYAGNRVISPDTYHVSTTLGDCYRASVAFAPHPAEREG